MWLLKNSHPGNPDKSDRVDFFYVPIVGISCYWPPGPDKRGNGTIEPSSSTGIRQGRMEVLVSRGRGSRTLVHGHADTAPLIFLPRSAPARITPPDPNSCVLRLRSASVRVVFSGLFELRIRSYRPSRHRLDCLFTYTGLFRRVGALKVIELTP